MEASKYASDSSDLHELKAAAIMDEWRCVRMVEAFAIFVASVLPKDTSPNLLFAIALLAIFVEYAMGYPREYAEHNSASGRWKLLVKVLSRDERGPPVVTALEKFQRDLNDRELLDHVRDSSPTGLGYLPRLVFGESASALEEEGHVEDGGD